MKNLKNVLVEVIFCFISFSLSVPRISLATLYLYLDFSSKLISSGSEFLRGNFFTADQGRDVLFPLLYTELLRRGIPVRRQLPIRQLSLPAAALRFRFRATRRHGLLLHRLRRGETLADHFRLRVAERLLLYRRRSETLDGGRRGGGLLRESRPVLLILRDFRRGTRRLIVPRLLRRVVHLLPVSSRALHCVHLVQAANKRVSSRKQTVSSLRLHPWRSLALR